jgi:beta-aspartyl-peptidase (threonine type)
MADEQTPTPGGSARALGSLWAVAAGLFLLVVLGLVLVQGALDYLRVGKARTEIVAVLDAQVEAWNRGDLDAFMTGYWHSDELEFRSGGTVTKGWQATLDRYRKRYQSEGREMGKLGFSDVEVEVFGPDEAMVRGRWTLVTSKETLGGLYTLLFRRFGDRWLIVYDHTSAADPPKKPE